MNKLFFFDIDLTICNQTFDVPTSTIKTIQALKDRGHIVALSSGRAKYSMQKYIDLLGIDHYVCSEGNSAYKNHERIYSNPMDVDFVQSLLAFCHEHQLTAGMISDHGNDVTLIDDAVLSFDDEMNLGTHQLEPRSYLKHDIYKVYIYHGLQYLDLFKPWMDKYPTYEFKGGLVFATVGKEKGIEALLKEMNIKKEDIVVFGDGKNDLTMFQYAHTAIAMGNAVDELKKEATYITKSIDEDGIEHACVHFGWL